jgi:hypothetical protein
LEISVARVNRQLKAYGREAMELDPKLRLEDAARGVTLEDQTLSESVWRRNDCPRNNTRNYE